MFAKLLLFPFGISVGVLFSIVANDAAALSQSLELDIVDDQVLFESKTGDYYSDVKDPALTINTYETLCKGFYIVEDDGSGIVRSVGYGDLSEDYSYEYEKPVVSHVASSTTVKPVVDASLDI